jgi:hypothetical protein
VLTEAVAEEPKRPDNPFANTTPPAEFIDIVPDFRLSLADAEDILHLYRVSYSPLFPFVPVPQSSSAYDLYVKKPLLFRTIMGVTAPQSVSIQKAMALWFREYIAEHVVVKQEKSLEMLQAILICIAW